MLLGNPSGLNIMTKLTMTSNTNSSMILYLKSSPENVKTLVKKKKGNPGRNELPEEEMEIKIWEEECVNIIGK